MPCDEGDEAGQYSTGLGLERLVFLLLLIFFFFFFSLGIMQQKLGPLRAVPVCTHLWH